MCEPTSTSLGASGKIAEVDAKAELATPLDVMVVGMTSVIFTSPRVNDITALCTK
jgi:hypothetical protein